MPIEWLDESPPGIQWEDGPTSPEKIRGRQMTQAAMATGNAVPLQGGPGGYSAMGFLGDKATEWMAANRISADPSVALGQFTAGGAQGLATLALGGLPIAGAAGAAAGAGRLAAYQPVIKAFADLSTKVSPGFARVFGEAALSKVPTFLALAKGAVAAAPRAIAAVPGAAAGSLAASGIEAATGLPSAPANIEDALARALRSGKEMGEFELLGGGLGAVWKAHRIAQIAEQVKTAEALDAAGAVTLGRPGAFLAQRTKAGQEILDAELAQRTAALPASETPDALRVRLVRAGVDPADLGAGDLEALKKTLTRKAEARVADYQKAKAALADQTERVLSAEAHQQTVAKMLDDLGPASEPGASVPQVAETWAKASQRITDTATSQEKAAVALLRRPGLTVDTRSLGSTIMALERAVPRIEKGTGRQFTAMPEQEKALLSDVAAGDRPRTLRWSLNPGEEGSTVLLVPTKDAEALWRQGAGATGAFIPGAAERTPQQLADMRSFGLEMNRRASKRLSSKPVWATYDAEAPLEQRFQLADGRHRLAWAAENGVKEVPVKMSAEDAAAFIQDHPGLGRANVENAPSLGIPLPSANAAQDPAALFVSQKAANQMIYRLRREAATGGASNRFLIEKLEAYVKGSRQILHDFAFENLGPEAAGFLRSTTRWYNKAAVVQDFLTQVAKKDHARLADLIAPGTIEGGGARGWSMIQRAIRTASGEKYVADFGNVRYGNPISPAAAQLQSAVKRDFLEKLLTTKQGTDIAGFAKRADAYGDTMRAVFSSPEERLMIQRLKDISGQMRALELGVGPKMTVGRDAAQQAFRDAEAALESIATQARGAAGAAKEVDLHGRSLLAAAGGLFIAPKLAGLFAAGKIFQRPLTSAIINASLKRESAGALRAALEAAKAGDPTASKLIYTALVGREVDRFRRGAGRYGAAPPPTPAPARR